MTLGSKARTTCKHMRSTEARWKRLTEGSVRIAITSITTVVIITTGAVVVVTAVVVTAIVFAAVAAGLIVLIRSVNRKGW